MPNVTLPPADDRPPRARKAKTIQKDGARAQGICHKFTRPSDHCSTQYRPNSSDQGAQSSQPKAYITKKINWPSLALDALIPKVVFMPGTALA